MGILDHDKYSNTTSSSVELGHIAHYYGDSVRILFVVVAAVWLVSLPFYPDLLPFDPAGQVLAGVTIVILAALTSPRNKWVLAFDALFAGFGVIVVEVTAVYGFREGTLTEFFIRELIVILFLVALYLSLKTLRAMLAHQIGKKGYLP